MDPKWLRWAKMLQAEAQNGLTYNPDPYSQQRYEMIRRIASEMMAAYTEGEIEQVMGLFAGEIGHATPKVDVRGVVFRDDRILLVKERAEGLWSLPGGWADVYDTPSTATVREIFEESGYRTRATRLLGVLDRDKQGHPPMPFHAYKVFFLCELIGGEATHSIETDGVDFFAEDDLPPLSLGRVTPIQIARFFEFHRQPDLPADFD